MNALSRYRLYHSRCAISRICNPFPDGKIINNRIDGHFAMCSTNGKCTPCVESGKPGEDGFNVCPTLQNIKLTNYINNSSIKEYCESAGTTTVTDGLTMSMFSEAVGDTIYYCSKDCAQIQNKARQQIAKNTDLLSLYLLNTDLCQMDQGYDFTLYTTNPIIKNYNQTLGMLNLLNDNKTHYDDCKSVDCHTFCSFAGFNNFEFSILLVNLVLFSV